MLQRVTAEVQPQLAAKVDGAVRLDRTRLVRVTLSHRFFCSRYTTKHIPHTCGRTSCRPARYLSSNIHNQISNRCLATALRVPSSTTTALYILNQNYSHEGKHDKLTLTDIAGVAAVAGAAASCGFILHEPLLLCVCRRSFLFLGS